LGRVDLTGSFDYSGVIFGGIAKNPGNDNWIKRSVKRSQKTSPQSDVFFGLI